MSGRMRGAVLLGLLGALAGCSQLKKGHCYHVSDCFDGGAGFMCIQGTCLPILHDAGMKPEDAGRDAAVDKAPPTCKDDGGIVCKDPTAICGDDGKCRGCINTTECRGGLVCDAPDGGTGTCVECTDNTSCKTAVAPVCDTSTHMCGPCTADTDCGAFLPSVCKEGVATGDAAPPAARCVTSDLEIIYVGKIGSTGLCSDTPAATDAGVPDAGASLPGTMALPFCSMQPALNAITMRRNVIVVTGSVGAGTWTYADQAKGPLLIVGKNTAKILSTNLPAFSMSSGNVTIRNVLFTSSLSMGIEASGGTLTLDRVTADQCAGGGILFDGASFDVENSRITGNATAMDGLVTWSGIYVKTMPAGGSWKLNQVTITNNMNAGLLCAGPVSGINVLAYKNMGGVDIGTMCGLTSCGSPDGAAPAKCGAQM